MLSPTLVFGILVLADVSHGYTCYSSGRSLTCSNGCCGGSSYLYCCPGVNEARISLIIGIVCSVVLTIAVTVGLVICCVRCCRSATGPQGHVVTTGQPLAIITAGPNTTPGAYNAGYGYPIQPDPEAHYTHLQPAGTAQPGGATTS